MMNKCKRCGLKTNLSQQDIDKMIDDVKRMKGIKLAQDEEYKKRLEICFNCEKLEYGCTCSLCGCVVHVRAMLKDGRCPFPKQSKWQV